MIRSRPAQQPLHGPLARPVGWREPATRGARISLTGSARGLSEKLVDPIPFIFPGTVRCAHLAKYPRPHESLIESAECANYRRNEAVLMGSTEVCKFALRSRSVSSPSGKIIRSVA